MLQGADAMTRCEATYRTDKNSLIQCKLEKDHDTMHESNDIKWYGMMSRYYKDVKCITFDSQKEFTKAFGVLMQNFGFSAVDERTITLSEEACKAMENEGIKFTYED